MLPGRAWPWTWKGTGTGCWLECSKKAAGKMTVLAIQRRKLRKRNRPLSADSGRNIGDSLGLSDHVAKQAVEYFKLLADETRLRIVYVLKQRGELNVQTMCRILQLTQPAVSHHLALLRVAGLIELRRAGKHNFYRLMPERFAEIAASLRVFMPADTPVLSSM
jgi:DNA-binding transcriptional ArsR family regulator